MKLCVDEIEDAQDRENEMSFIIQVHRMLEQYGENFDEYLDSQLEIVRTEQEDSSWFDAVILYIFSWVGTLPIWIKIKSFWSQQYTPIFLKKSARHYNDRNESTVSKTAAARL